MIIDLGDYDDPLTLGFGDGGTYDNSGGYGITVWQAALAPTPTPVPEPTTIALFTLGAAGVAAASRRRKRAQ